MGSALFSCQPVLRRGQAHQVATENLIRNN